MKQLHTNINIKSTSKHTIARADDVFSYIDSDFENYCTDKKSPKTEETKVAVLEMEKDGTFKQIFGELSSDLDSLCLTQAQIIAFAKEQKDKLNQVWYNFFLFKEDNEFFVADVRVDAGRLGAYVLRFSDDDVWRAGYRRRVVVPQVALKFSVSDTKTLGPSDTLPESLTINGVVYVRK